MGQILEVHLGWIAQQGWKIEGNPEWAIEIPENAREAAPGTKVATPVFDGAHESEISGLLDSTLPAHLLLDRALAIEAAFGRDRSGERNAPRPLDVDLIVVGKRKANEEELTLPHPRAHERAFVLVPWHEVEADAELPGHGPIAELLEKVDQSGVVRREDLELHL